MYQTQKIVPLLNIILKSSPENRCILLAHLDPSAYDTIIYCVSLVLTSNTISKRDRTYLNRVLAVDKDSLRFLINKKISKSRKIQLTYFNLQITRA